MAENRENFDDQAMPTVVASQNGGTTGNLSEHVAGQPWGTSDVKNPLFVVFEPLQSGPPKKWP